MNSTGHAPRKQRSTTTDENIPSNGNIVEWIYSGAGSLCLCIFIYSYFNVDLAPSHHLLPNLQSSRLRGRPLIEDMLL